MKLTHALCADKKGAPVEQASACLLFLHLNPNPKGWRFREVMHFRAGQRLKPVYSPGLYGTVETVPYNDSSDAIPNSGSPCLFG
jgi:hypothetical protein